MKASLLQFSLSSLGMVNIFSFSHFFCKWKGVFFGFYLLFLWLILADSFPVLIFWSTDLATWRVWSNPSFSFIFFLLLNWRPLYVFWYKYFIRHTLQIVSSHLLLDNCFFKIFSIFRGSQLIILMKYNLLFFLHPLFWWHTKGIFAQSSVRKTFFCVLF